MNRTALVAVGALAAIALATAGFVLTRSSATAGGSSPAPFVRSVTGAPATVWAVGDGADGGRPARRIARFVAARRPDRFLYLGDVYERGTASDFAAGYAPVYGRLTGVTAPTPGNHEWPRRAVGYGPYWRKARGLRPPPYYAFSVAGWRILSLNSQAPHGVGSDQLAWLRQQLRAPGTCRIAFSHRPRWSAGTHGNQPDLAPLRNALVGHARIVLAGHDHDMQRFRARNGLVDFVVGSGGHGHYEVDRSRSDLAWSNARAGGALRLRLRPGVADYSFVRVDGLVLDSGRIRCRRA